MKITKLVRFVTALSRLRFMSIFSPEGIFGKTKNQSYFHYVSGNKIGLCLSVCN